MAKRRRTKKPNCNHPPDKREVIASESSHVAGEDHVQRVYRCTLCGCWKISFEKPKGGGTETESKWQAPKVALPFWARNKKTKNKA